MKNLLNNDTSNFPFLRELREIRETKKSGRGNLILFKQQKKSMKNAFNILI